MRTALRLAANHSKTIWRWRWRWSLRFLTAFDPDDSRVANRGVSLDSTNVESITPFSRGALSRGVPLTAVPNLRNVIRTALAPSVTVARLTLDQLVKVQILGGQLLRKPLPQRHLRQGLSKTEASCEAPGQLSGQLSRRRYSRMPRQAKPWWNKQRQPYWSVKRIESCGAKNTFEP